MNALRVRLFGDGHRYKPVDGENVPAGLWTRKHSLLGILLILLGGVVAVFVSGFGDPSESSSLGVWPWHGSCDTTFHGYDCEPGISRYWGQYSPYFAVPSEIGSAHPEDCEITFAQVLSRHGARDPTLFKTQRYAATIDKIQANVKEFKGNYAFLADYTYNLGADQLTNFGQQQLVNSGIKFYERYNGLTYKLPPFVRASGQERVIQSALNFTQGFFEAKAADLKAIHGNDERPYVDVIISEDEDMNNTLHHDLCAEFENGPASNTGSDAQSVWARIFVPPIRMRLNRDLTGARLNITDVIDLMDMCSFDTVASPLGTISPFCNLFNENEWHQYDYFETLGKYYGYSHGNPLGPTQGVGFVNELIARMTNGTVQDHTSTNRTLDGDYNTFPINRPLYADFSHDNDMTAIFSAFGFYKNSSLLSKTSITEPREADGFSASWTVPFAARAYFEKMRCKYNSTELVRVLINDRVLNLTQCYGDLEGRCTLANFTASLSFARAGGHWNRCFR